MYVSVSSMHCINWQLDQEAWSAMFDLLVKAASSVALSSVRRHKMCGCLSLLMALAAVCAPCPDSLGHRVVMY